MGMASDYYENLYEPQLRVLNDTIDLLKGRLAHYEEEVARLRAQNERLENSFIDINLDCDKKLEDAQEIVVDLLATGERLANQLEAQQSMPDKHNGWWIPSLATARVWIAQRNKR
jgi:predicted  nucleic acid-binding Zn-ribbon protein